MNVCFLASKFSTFETSINDMYVQSQIRELQQQTSEWLQSPPALSEKNIESLRNILRFHEHRYYIENDPLISDFEYDSLFKKLELCYHERIPEFQYCG